MFSRTSSAATYGIDGIIIDIECHIEGQLPSFTIVGLPDNAVKESRERVMSAIKNSGFPLPPKKITVNLAPANIKKEGSSFDLPIAIGILEALGQISVPENSLFLGELSLDGKVRSINGILPITIEAQKKNFHRFFVPKENAPEASAINNIIIEPVSTLREVVEIIKSGKFTNQTIKFNTSLQPDYGQMLDFSDVKGQEHVKRAIEIGAAAMHNIVFLGPPGSGKSMLSKRIPSILPNLTQSESLETTKIYSITGNLKNNGLIRSRPFRSPHHTISDIALIGGGRGLPSPGEVSLAHNGVLFLDELPEFKKSVLEVLRQPLEDGHVTIARANASLTFPAQFMLVAAMNPCPCGYSTDPKRECSCSLNDIQRYLGKISGPLLDRIDLHVEVPQVDIEQLGTREKGESSEKIRKRVNTARDIQTERFKENERIHTNSSMNQQHIEEFCQLDSNSIQLLKQAMEKLGLSARAYNRILKVSRTIADLDGVTTIQANHIAEAIQYRSLDRQFGFN
jgi:magnesium chelatase family protein